MSHVISASHGVEKTQKSMSRVLYLHNFIPSGGSRISRRGRAPIGGVDHRRGHFLVKIMRK